MLEIKGEKTMLLIFQECLRRLNNEKKRVILCLARSDFYRSFNFYNFSSAVRMKKEESNFYWKREIKVSGERITNIPYVKTFHVKSTEWHFSPSNTDWNASGRSMSYIERTLILNHSLGAVLTSIQYWIWWFFLN